MTKLLVIGFDGMDYFMAKKTIGVYPFKSFKPILKKQVTKETVTGPSWASFYTGLNKAVHGVTDGWGRETNGSNTFQDIQAHAFWNIVSEAGYRVYVDNLPITADGFPFTSSKQNDIINWIYDPLEGGYARWRNSIRVMGFEEVLSKTRRYSLNLANAARLADQDLIFIQFSFLDRIGHAFTFENERVMQKSYALAYELIDRLFETTSPEYLIVVSDHGFWRNTTRHLGADCAGLILNAESYNFFRDNHIFKPFSIFSGLNRSKVKAVLANLSPIDILQFVFRFDYVNQTDIFDTILQMFMVEYKKTNQKITKTKEVSYSDQEAKEITERLKRLGYL